MLKETFERFHLRVSAMYNAHSLLAVLSTSSSEPINTQASVLLLIRSQRLSDLISKATSNILQAIRRSIDLGRCQSSCQAELTRDPFYAVCGVDVLDQGDLIASRRALAGDDG